MGSVSGAHFNPAVTTAIVLTGASDDCTLAAMPIYVLAQCLGGVAAAFSSAAAERCAIVDSSQNSEVNY